MNLTVDSIKDILAMVIDPYTHADLISARTVKNIQIQGQVLQIDLVFGYPLDDSSLIQAQIQETLSKSFPSISVKTQTSWQVEPRAVQANLKGITGIKNIIAVASGKGGVGKSTTTVNLAMALSGKGAKVGILDADIYGPNVPQMLGASEIKAAQNENKLCPVERYGIKSMSIGYLIDTNTPVVWRGPMVTSALIQLLHDTKWDNLDYLFIDLPPGTGDIQLTLAQKIPVSGGIIVTTPQDVALLDAKKGIEMFNKVRIPILGIIENMSVHICSQCGHRDLIFGEGGGKKISHEYDVPLLGNLPLQQSIRVHSDKGCPIVMAEPMGEVAKVYGEVALRTAALLSLQARDYSTHFPKITIENN